jgi:hypothetical protein
MAMNLDGISVLLLAALWVVFLWDPLMRTLRSVAFLTVVSAVVVVATYLPAPLVPWVQSVAVASIAAVLLFWNRPFRALPDEDQDFIRQLDDVNTQLNAAAGEFEEDPSQRQRWRQSLWGAMTRLTSVSPPSEEWAEARAEVLALLRRRIELLDQGGISEEERREFVAQKERAHQRISAARAKRTSFWRL